MPNFIRGYATYIAISFVMGLIPRSLRSIMVFLGLCWGAIYVVGMPTILDFAKSHNMDGPALTELATTVHQDLKPALDKLGAQIAYHTNKAFNRFDL